MKRVPVEPRGLRSTTCTTISGTSSGDSGDLFARMMARASGVTDLAAIGADSSVSGEDSRACVVGGGSGEAVAAEMVWSLGENGVRSGRCL